MGGDRTKPDLFSNGAPLLDIGAPSTTLGTHIATPLHRHFLPKDLPTAIKNLTDQELDQLHTAVLIELQRRGRKLPSNENVSKRRLRETDVPLTVGRLNAIRAAFKAGITPSRIARQFRISQSAVRKALAGDKP
jgi:hypothetical protein